MKRDINYLATIQNSAKRNIEIALYMADIVVTLMFGDVEDANVQVDRLREQIAEVENGTANERNFFTPEDIVYYEFPSEEEKEEASKRCLIFGDGRTTPYKPVSTIAQLYELIADAMRTHEAYPTYLTDEALDKVDIETKFDCLRVSVVTSRKSRLKEQG